MMILKIMPKQKWYFHLLNFLGLVGLLNRLYDFWKPEKNQAIKMVGNCVALIITIGFFLYTNHTLTSEASDRKKVIQEIE